MCYDSLKQELNKSFPQTPPEIRSMIGQEVARQMDNKKTAFSPRRRSRRRRLPLLIFAAALLLGTVSFAGIQLYQLYMENEGAYGRTIHVEGTGTNGDTNASAESTATAWLQFGYIPEDMFLEPNSFKLSFADSSWAMTIIRHPLKSDTSAESLALSEQYVTFSEELEINGRAAVYLTIQRSADAEAQTKVYMLCPEAETVLEVYAAPELSKETLVKVLENVTPAAADAVSPDSANEAAKSMESPLESAIRFFCSLLPARETNDYQPQTRFTAEEIEAMHDIGDAVSVPMGADTPQKQHDVTNDITAVVTDVQISDNLTLLDRPEYIPDHWADITDENGNLLPAEITYLRRQDGVNALDEIVETETIAQKLVYTTITYTNNGSETLKNICFRIDLCGIAEKNDGYLLYADRAEMYNADAQLRGGLSCDYANSTGAASFEAGYFDPHGGDGMHGGNYITELKPQETVTIHTAYIVNADELPYLFVDLNAIWGDDYQGTEAQRYVDIRQQ